MRVIALLFLVYVACCLSACSKRDNTGNMDGDDYGEYEIEQPDRFEASDGPVTHRIDILQMKFVPEVLNVQEGDTVVWTNSDIVLHDVVELNKNLWNSEPLKPGATFKTVVKLSQAYYCSLHVVMRGKIVVDGRDIAMNSGSSITMCGN
ncbi:MAG TPA: hypothetical protein VEB86_04405 [Chryseosolibacter sp.]|nr:hypothetical protein [Chryseosolibacter sp.]